MQLYGRAGWQLRFVNECLGAIDVVNAASSNPWDESHQENRKMLETGLGGALPTR